MKEFKGTKGKWDISKGLNVYANGVNIYSSTLLLNEFENEANAELIADAGNTIQKCGYLPSELLNQKDELVDALLESMKQIEYLNFKFKETGTSNAVLSRINNLINKINQQ